MGSEEFALVRIPDHLDFGDLNLSFDPMSGIIEFDGAPICEVLEANPDLNPKRDEELVDLITAWYRYLRLKGYRNEVAEQCLIGFAAAQAFGIDRVQAGPDTAH